jgi:hypothetical protein
MAYVPPNAATFKARFPEFASLTDPFIQILLDEADIFTDGRWVDRDRSVAVLHLAAHAAQQSLLAQQEFSSSSGDSNTTDDSFLFVKTIRFSDREITWDKKKSSGSSSSSSSSRMGSPYADTIYGQRFLQLRQRNIGGPLVV